MHLKAASSAVGSWPPPSAAGGKRRLAALWVASGSVRVLGRAIDQQRFSYWDSGCKHRGVCLPGGRWAGSLSAGHLSSAAMNKIIHQAVAPPQRRLFSKPRTPPKPTRVFLFMPRPLIYHVALVAPLRRTVGVVGSFLQTISDNLRMLCSYSVL